MRRVGVILAIALMGALLVPGLVSAQLPQSEVKAALSGGNTGTIGTAGYTSDGSCTDGRSKEGGAALGAEGFRYVKASLVDGTFDELQPEAYLVHPQTGRTTGVVYQVNDVGQTAPTLFGQAFGVTAAGYELTWWIDDNSAGQHAEMNAALPLCPEDSISAELQGLGTGTATISNGSATNDKVDIAMTAVSSPGQASIYEGWLVSPRIVTVALTELNASGQTGTATLTETGDQTAVAVTATASISDTNHIHSGSCGALGSAAYTLDSSSSGTATTVLDVSIDDLLTGGFAVNLHDATDAATSTSCGNIPARATSGGNLSLGRLDVGGAGVATLSYTSPTGANLSASNSSIQVTVESAPDSATASSGVVAFSGSVDGLTATITDPTHTPVVVAPTPAPVVLPETGATYLPFAMGMMGLLGMALVVGGVILRKTSSR